jgi:HD-GYP domain-containing protein (c-di-GMP phosphodiesterase class II)
MIRINVTSLEPGMVLAAPIPHPANPQRILLNAGFAFDAYTIRQLARFAVFTVWVHHPGFEFLDERLSSVIPQARVGLYESVKRSFSGLADHVSGSFNLLEYRTLISNMIVSMVTEKDHAVWAERMMQGESELFGHSANVAYLSLVLGLRLKRYLGSERRYVHGAQSEDLTNLGIGAMFHDLGKLGMKRQWQRTHSFEKTVEDPEYRTHPERGFKALQGRLEATAATVVLHHHQRFDGEGFPELKSQFEEREQKQFVGHNIHVFARVVALANVLDGLIHACETSNRPTIAALAAVHQPPLVGMFDPVVLRAALRCLPPFPLGTVVTLSDGQVAVVTDLNKSSPWEPQVRPISNPDAPDKVGDEIDLSAKGTPDVEQEHGRCVTPYLKVLRAAARPASKSGASDEEPSE